MKNITKALVVSGSRQASEGTCQVLIGDTIGFENTNFNDGYDTLLMPICRLISTQVGNQYAPVGGERAIVWHAQCGWLAKLYHGPDDSSLGPSGEQGIQHRSAAAVVQAIQKGGTDSGDGGYDSGKGLNVFLSLTPTTMLFTSIRAVKTRRLKHCTSAALIIPKVRPLRRKAYRSTAATFCRRLVSDLTFSQMLGIPLSRAIALSCARNSAIIIRIVLQAILRLGAARFSVSSIAAKDAG